MAKEARTRLAWEVGGSLLFLLLVGGGVPLFLKERYIYTYRPEENLAASAESASVAVTHLPTPEPLKALYMTSCVAATPSWRASLKEIVDNTELNAVVIDIKDYTGTVAFPNSFPRLRQGYGGQAKGCVVKDMKEFIAELHESEIYAIGRVSVFQDVSYSNLFPELAVKSLSTGGVWKDHKGLSFIDVAATPYWDYIVNISKEAYALGFDELNYDYVRYPSDGNMQDVHYSWAIGTSTRAATLESFFSYIHDNLKELGVKTSVDLFGMTTTVEGDMGIGQVLERALPYFDYVAPMVYPSHYPPTWNGFANPAEHPYEVIKIAMAKGLEREQAWLLSNNLSTSTTSKLRPWLQDFNLGATYGPDKIQAQIEATYDTGLTSWMLWSAANKYTSSALLPDESKSLKAER
jgi:hypothetical protein